MSDVDQDQAVPADRVEPPETSQLPENFGENHLDVWERLEETDPRFTKRMTTGAKLTSINAEYQIRRMTEVFGMAGAGWGFDMVSSDFVNCGEMFARPDDQGNRKSLGELIIHTARVKLWYLHPQSGEKCEVQATGHTKFRYMATRDGYEYATVDEEYEKKSITDALTKAMSFLGMAADVRMGLFDVPDYVKGRYDAVAIEEAEDTATEVTRQRHQFEDWLEQATKLMNSAGSLRELEIIYKGALPRVERQGTQDQQKAFRETKNEKARAFVVAARQQTEKHAESTGENSTQDSKGKADPKAKGGDKPA